MANSVAFGYLGDTDAEQGRQLASGGFTCGRTYAPNAQDRRLTSIDCPIPTGPNLLPKWSYEVDQLDRVTAIKSGRHESYFGYDSANRLTSRLQALIDPATGQGPVGFNLFTLDAADNLLNVSRSNFGNGAPADTAASFSVNALNQAVSQSGAALKYDANGNLTEDGGAIYTWDARDRLVAITSKATGTRTAIQYDGLDRWAVITDAGKEVRYRWCGQELCAALDAAGKAKAHYFGDRGMYVLLANGQAQRVAFVTDHLGSVKQYHDTAGKWLLSLDHEAYGGISRADLSPAGISLLNSGVVVPGWAGLYMHWPTGTYLATYRPYSSQLKRWMKRDPIEEGGGLNLYGYVGGEPVGRIDPNGLQALPLPPPVLPPPGVPNQGPPSNPLPSLSWPKLLPDSLVDAIIAACTETPEACRQKCDIANEAQVKICSNAPTARARQACYSRANELYALCLRKCKLS